MFTLMLILLMTEFLIPVDNISHHNIIMLMITGLYCPVGSATVIKCELVLESS